MTWAFFIYVVYSVPDLSQFIFFIIGCLATFALVCLVFPRLFRSKQKFFPRRVITAFESKMFHRLNEAFPNYHILAQVAFSALITNQNYKIRNRFNRKVTDFVILDQTYNVLVIIELDDRSHIGKEQEDAERDAMLEEAGYRVIRHTSIPTVHTLRHDINK
ncbi:DUF2726 domain-containing protein [Acinetobacter sp. YH12054]|uniref:DUF2726 domain-containing protein n=1 Tax=Acinetobacter sp. YH12054 TaxID=2601056 RepID=UPI001C555694|nr:DUF2726 domain-containing protein [Acinetobacter sp. YH12054]